MPSMKLPNPLEDAPAGEEPVSAKTFCISGILTTVYGLEELPNTSDVACLWLMHPRLQKQEIMAQVAYMAINLWNKKLKESPALQRQPKGLIAVAFDQRNHGTRLISELANEAWRSGNPTHAQDMYSMFHGTATDVSLLINYLSSYVFPDSSRKLVQHLALGVSLGGHATWQLLLREPRITAGVVIIGCPDFVRLMSNRAAKSKLESWTSTDPPGRDFLGSKDFPKGLLEAIEKFDPAGTLMGELDTVTGDDHLHEPSEAEKTRIRPMLRDTLGGKSILCLSGGVDKLVPYADSKPFLDWLKNGIKEGGWAADQDIVLEDIVDDKAGHEYSALMKKEAGRFIMEAVAGEISTGTGNRSSKI